MTVHRPFPAFLITTCIVVTCSASMTSSDDDHDVTAYTKYGSVRGTRVHEDYELAHSKVTSYVDKYLGIPYASPPIGQRRFRPPEPPEAWTDPRDAKHHGNVCPQVSYHPSTNYSYQNEDCLYLAVYTPYQPSEPDRTYPVMVFIHGGSFEVGSGKLYDGTVLAQLGVVVVIINYRLGALGFLSTGTDELRGNLGLMDQVMSLTWVRENIEAFHGNRHQVTVFGHSAGGASVGLLLVLPQAEGLFHGIIAQSGSAVASYCVHDKDVDFQAYVRQVGSLFLCEQTYIPDILDCLRDVPSEQFIAKRPMFPLYDPIDPEFRPYIDGTWVSDHPTRLFLRGNFHKVPVITGTVQNEFANYFNGGARHRQTFDEALDRYVSKYVKYDDVMNLVKYEYKDWEGTTLEEYDRGSVLSDMHMVAPTVQLAQVISRHSDEVFQYHFTIQDCYHSMELNYVFGAPFSGRLADEMSENMDGINFTVRDKHFSVQMMMLWSNFAKHGHPTPMGSVGTPTWKPFSQKNKWYMRLNPEELRMEKNLRQDKVAFWNDIVPHLWTMDCVPKAGSSACQQYQNRVHLWVFMVIVTVLFLLIILLITLFIRTLKQLQLYKRTLCMDGKGSENGKMEIKPAKV